MNAPPIDSQFSSNVGIVDKRLLFCQFGCYIEFTLIVPLNSILYHRPNDELLAAGIN